MKSNQYILLIGLIAFVAAFVGTGFTVIKLLVGVMIALLIYGGLYFFYFKKKK